MILRPARAALREWMASDSARTQTALAEALGVTQQTVSALLKDRDPSQELARLVEAATGIPWAGWFSSHELRRWDERLERARRFRELSGAAA